MLTILSRILPYDISEYIYQIYKNDCINDIMIPKVYMFELTLENLIYIYNNNENDILSIHINGFHLISNCIKRIKRYNYKISKELDIKINIFKNQINYRLLKSEARCDNEILVKNILFDLLK